MLSKWSHPAPSLLSGVIVGCDAKQEWILPWWWNHYSAHNIAPVLFVDFGLSSEAALWCEQKGKVISLPHDLPLVKPKEELEKTTTARWEAAFGDGFWRARPSWFKKPFALLQTPFEKTLWLDLDCEVKADLSPLFSGLTEEISLAPETTYAHKHMQTFSLCEQQETIYNSGVILYRHGSPTILDWAQASIDRNDAFWSDQHLLSRLIYEKQRKIVELPQLYNWHMGLGKNEQARIIHWLGDIGKEYISLNLHGYL